MANMPKQVAFGHKNSNTGSGGAGKQRTVRLSWSVGHTSRTVGKGKGLEDKLQRLHPAHKECFSEGEPTLALQGSQVLYEKRHVAHF